MPNFFKKQISTAASYTVTSVSLSVLLKSTPKFYFYNLLLKHLKVAKKALLKFVNLSVLPENKTKILSGKTDRFDSKTR